MSLWMVSMATAQDPIPQAPPQQEGTSQDPFDAAAKDATGSSAKGSAQASGKMITPAEEKTAGEKSVKKPEPEFVQKTLREWQRILPRGVFEVTRLKATEPPFSGRFATGHFEGTFVCACCDAELFSSRNKFDSGTGWPSFWQPVKARAIDRAIDNSEAEPRIEVMCHRCGAHLGHVFDDAPATPTGLRYCINSLSLKLVSAEGEAAKPASAKARSKSKVKTTRARSRGTSPSSRTTGTAGTNGPETPKSGDQTKTGSETPATGKPDGNGR
jgi:peptide-methionine (R)-S-oxide reductase